MAGAADEIVIDVPSPQVRLRAELDLFVNEARAGTSVVVLEAGDALVLPSDLERAGLVVRGGTRVTVDDRQLVSLRSLAPAVQFVVDERALALRITAAPELLGRHVLDLRPRTRPAAVEQRFDSSAFLDYALDSDLAGHAGLAFDGGGRVGRWLARSDVSRSYGGLWTRGLTSAVRDDVPRLERLTVGDTAVSSGLLGGTALLGGISVGREFSLDPYLVTAPFPTTTAVITAPSTLEVYVNGAMVRQQAIAPGYWNLSNVPATAGQTMVRAVVRDAFGRERAIDSRFYFSSGLLAPGLTDFGLAAGFLREGFGTASFDYGTPAAIGRYRFAFSDWLTPGFRAEASEHVASGGASATFGTPWGEAETDVAASGAGGDAGAAAQLSWQWVSARYSAGLRLGAQTERYANLSVAPGQDRALLDAQANVGATVVRGMAFELALRAGRFRDLGPFASAELRGTVQIGWGASLSLSGDYGRTQGGPTGLQLLAILAWGRAGFSADASVTRDRDGHAIASAEASRTLGREDGVGYRVHTAGGDQTKEADGTLQGQTSFGRAELQATRASGLTTYHAQAAGGLVYIDRRLGFARPTDGSYALVRSGELGGVGVTVENAPTGTTGADGTLLVTDLQPYYGSRIALRERDIPDVYELGHVERVVAPPFRGGAVVSFDLRRISALTGQLTMRLQDREERPANGELSVIVDGELRTSPITEDGRFFLERMPPGKHVVQAIWGGGSCRAAVTLPPGAPPVFDAGQVRCIPDVLEPGGRLPKLTDPGYAEGAFPPDPEKGAGAGGR